MGICSSTKAEPVLKIKLPEVVSIDAEEKRELRLKVFAKKMISAPVLQIENSNLFERRKGSDNK